MRLAVFSLALLTAVPGFSASMLSVSAEQVNVRSGPGADFDVVWRAARYYPLEILDSSGKWLMVSDYANDEGWVSRSVLSYVPTVVVVTEKANVREGPGLEYGISWVLGKEHSLKVLDVSGSWYKVTDGEEVEGWIHRSVAWGFTGRAELESRGQY